MLDYLLHIFAIEVYHPSAGGALKVKMVVAFAVLSRKLVASALPLARKVFNNQLVSFKPIKASVYCRNVGCLTVRYEIIIYLLDRRRLFSVIAKIAEYKLTVLCVITKASHIKPSARVILSQLRLAFKRVGKSQGKGGAALLVALRRKPRVD